MESTETAVKKIPENIIRPMPVCFVCLGNTCRSPMAEAVYNDMFSSEGKFAVSAGLMHPGSPISPGAARALEKRGIVSGNSNRYLEHTSRILTKQVILSSSRIIAMTHEMLMQLILSFPQYTTYFSSMPRDIPDPYGCPQKVYDSCLEEIVRGISEMFGKAQP